MTHQESDPERLVPSPGSGASETVSLAPEEVSRDLAPTKAPLGSGTLDDLTRASSPALAGAGSGGAAIEVASEPQPPSIAAVQAESEPTTPSTAAPQAENAPATLPASAPARRAPRKGNRVSGKLVKLTEDSAFVDFGGREEGVLEVRELKDAKGELTKKLGDTVQASVVSTEGGIKLTISAARKKGNLPAVLEASRNGTPLEGRVTGVNKGGLVVRVMGVRAFCPFSQIDRHYVEDPSTFIGKRLTFRVSSADEKGKNVVLSRRAHLEEEVRGRAHLVRAELAVGKEMTGVVARLRPFGAFVDLGGIDGLVHVSEISHTRLTDPAEALKVGQEVRVKVVKIEKLGEPGERISLSIKGLQTDPWDAVSSQYQPGTKVEGKIVRLVDFGAFVELAPGVDGLIHVSALAAERVEHPSKVVNVGDPVHAWIVKIEPKTRRISLSLVEPQARAEQPRRKKAPPPKREERPQSREARDFRKTPSGMTSMEEAFERLRQRRVGD